jgi:hypothetical protein
MVEEKEGAERANAPHPNLRNPSEDTSLEALRQILNATGHAEHLASKGLPVFPYGNNKRPLTANGFKDASTDPAVINAWWHGHPDALLCRPGPSLLFWISTYSIQKRKTGTRKQTCR